VFALYEYQESLLFQPVIANLATPEQNPPEYRNPAEKKMKYEDVKFSTEDGETITGWFIPAKHPDENANPSEREKLQIECATMLYFHANAGNMGFRIPFLEGLHHHTPCNVLIISYRGYGHSTGKPTEDGVYKDAEASLDWLLRSKKVNPNRVLVFGRSLGGAVAINLAFKAGDKLKGVILENTFKSISEMADKLFPFLYSIKPFVLRMNFPSFDLIKSIKVPIMFISGLQDEIVPQDHMEALWGAATAAPWCRILRVPSGKHNDTWMQAEKDAKYFVVMRDFISKVIPDAPKQAPLEDAKQASNSAPSPEDGARVAS